MLNNVAIYVYSHYISVYLNHKLNLFCHICHLNELFIIQIVKCSGIKLLSLPLSLSFLLSLSFHLFFQNDANPIDIVEDPLPVSIIVVSPLSDIHQICTKRNWTMFWNNSSIIYLKSLLQKEKLLIISNFHLYHNILKVICCRCVKIRLKVLIGYNFASVRKSSAYIYAYFGSLESCSLSQLTWLKVTLAYN